MTSTRWALQTASPSYSLVILLAAVLMSIALVSYHQSEDLQLSSNANETMVCNLDGLSPNITHSSHLNRLSWEYFLRREQLDPINQALDTRKKSKHYQLSAGESFSLNTHIHHRLHRYEHLFREVAKEHRVDWHLLAAISYQESHWSPKAISPTGVRGMMMLTLTTAREMGIRNRLDAEQSIRGGMGYLTKIRDRLPDSIPEPERTWQALAAYNVGIGHLYDARTLTRKRGGNPDKWDDLKQNLLKLEYPEWYPKTRYGYARGSEPVRYVENIRRYYHHLLVRQGKTPTKEQAFASRNNKCKNKKIDPSTTKTASLL